MRRSLRSRLFAILSASIVTAWLATAFFSYLDTRRQIDEMLDLRLVQSADFILALIDRLPPDRLDRSFPDGDSSSMISYRVWNDAENTAIISSGAQAFLQHPSRPGFSDRAINGEAWRIYGARSAKGLFVEVAQRQAYRATFAENVATHIMHPVLFAIPLLGLLIWLSVRWSLTPLQTVANNVGSRSANDLIPLNPHDAPSEVRPLIDALNKLFARIGLLLDKERQFTADAAHELRTPLAAIKTHAQVAISAQSVEAAKSANMCVIEGTDRAIRLVEQLLVLARLDHQSVSLKRERVDLTRVLINAVMDATPAAAAKNIDLGVPGGGMGDTLIMGNGDLLAILVRNLLDNAVLYTPQGGTVNAEASQDNGEVVLTVNDTGPGIPEELRARVFDRFYRIEGSGEQGSGLGLSIAARIAEIHGASIALGDNHGRGGLSVAVIFPALPL